MVLKFQKICISMHFGFNNQFIKVMRTRPIFQNFQKKLFCFLLISRVMNLYVRCILNIKFLLLRLERLGFYPIRQGPHYRGELFLNHRQTNN